MSFVAAAAATSLAATATAAAWAVAREVRSKHAGLWLPGVLARRPAHDWRQQPTRVFIAVCDHYEPQWGHAEPSTAMERVGRWRDRYREQFDSCRDCRGQTPQHSFFFPADEYRPEYLDELAGLCARGAGDVDVHLHHDNDTAENLTQTLLSFRDTLHVRHGLLRRDPLSGEIVYGFIHGNWSLCNSRPDGRWCGVDQELGILRDTGCYADFTLPSAPSPTQTRTVNSIYYATDRPGCCKSHDAGVTARVDAARPDDALLMIQGPLGLDLRRRKWGVFPRIENADLTAANPPSLARWPGWLDAQVHVEGRPDWLFVKLHTHGCQPANESMWLGGAARQFHENLAAWQSQHSHVQYYYVTAWEMAQLVRQAEAGLVSPDWNALTTHAADRSAFNSPDPVNPLTRLSPV